jgi:hypothetical protein
MRPLDRRHRYVAICCALNYVSMLPSAEYGCRWQGMELASATYFGRVEDLDKRRRRGYWRQRQGIAMRRLNAIKHAPPEFRGGFQVRFRRVGLTRCRTAAPWSRWRDRPKYVALVATRSESPSSRRPVLSTQAAGCPSR